MGMDRNKKIRFRLTIQSEYAVFADANGNEQRYQGYELIIEDTFTMEEISRLMENWFEESLFLTSRVPGLVECGSSSLTPEMLELP